MMKLPLEFSSEFLVSKQGSEEWKAMRNKVREACQSYGCFLLLVREETIPINLREEMVMTMKGLFDLLEQTKQKHKSTNSFRAYQGKSPNFPLSESFGIDSSDQIDAAQAFTNLIEIMKLMSSKLMDLNYFTIVKMIFESFGIEKHYK
ncbi:putative non-heme dioxygenase domain, isopenicillin N synthase [Rosa chinensis]|uniref:Putative non-heme dioxygenase domain, isopenicillin N synthase n=1 Tax=Rosa chinensis TaxID=74649 RepID=A0A2P6Q720_ROSCH|nr:putative non-heme dioxygenase domain, isopenicillin N synthase [Rosa chinensis]